MKELLPDSPCRGCSKEKTCGTPCLKADEYLRKKWRDVRTMIITEVANAKR